MNVLRLFGGAALYTAAGPVAGRAAQRHRIGLLALLASTRRPHRNRDQLITYLWPDTGAERGRKLLSDSIYRVNQALGGDALVRVGDDVRLNRSLIACDVASVETAVEEHDWRRVVKCYRGDFLEGFYLPDSPDFEQWIERERAHYLRIAASALESLAIASRDAKLERESLDWWYRLSELVPDDSRVSMLLTRAINDSRQLLQVR